MNVDALKKRCQSLIELGLYDSVEAHCSLAICSKLPPNTDAIAIYNILTESFFLQHDYRKCISSLNSAFQHLGYSSAASSRINIDTDFLAALKVREAKCHFHLREYNLALKSLETVPAQLRSLDTQMTLVKCYKANGLRRQAATVQLELLKQLPFALEIVEDLISLNVSSDEVAAAVDGARSQASPIEAALLKAVANMLMVKHQLRYDECRRLFDKLLAQHPRCPFLLRHAAECYALSGGHSDEALAAYQQLRLVDRLSTRNMDLCGYLLLDAGAEVDLNRLASDVMQALDCGAADATRAEGWLLLAMLSAMRGEHDRTLRFVEKAVAADPRHWLTYLFKGRYYHSQGQHEAAVVSLMQSNAAFKSLAAYELLVDAHMQLGNMREATYTAREAVAAFGCSGAPLTLLGRVLVRAPGPTNENVARAGGVRKHAEALRCFEKALRLDPRHHLAAQLRAEVLLENGLQAECVAALQMALSAGAGVGARVLLGKVQGLTGQYAEAVQTLHLAVSLDPEDKTGALAELDRLEKKLKIDRDSGVYAPPDPNPAAAALPHRPVTRAVAAASVQRRGPHDTPPATTAAERRLAGRISFGTDEDGEEEVWEDYGGFDADDGDADLSGSGATEPHQEQEQESGGSPGEFMEFEFDSPNI